MLTCVYISVSGIYLYMVSVQMDAFQLDASRRPIHLSFGYKDILQVYGTIFIYKLSTTRYMWVKTTCTQLISKDIYFSFKKMQDVTYMPCRPCRNTPRVSVRSHLAFQRGWALFEGIGVSASSVCKPKQLHALPSWMNRHASFHCVKYYNRLTIFHFR